MQDRMARSVCKLFCTARTNYPDVKERPLDALKDALLQSKTLHQASIKAGTSLFRLIVFPSLAELRGIRNYLIQESNYCERGVLLWIAQGRFDCQHGLLLNCQNSHQSEEEASSCGRYILISPAYIMEAQYHQSDKNPFFILIGHFIWNMCLRNTESFTTP